MGIIGTLIIGLVAGAFVATYLGQAVGWYEAGEGAGFIGAVVGAIILLAAYRAMGSPGQGRAGAARRPRARS